MVVPWPGSHVHRGISLQTPCYGLASLFGFFACFYAIGYIPFSRTLAPWHFWLSVAGVVLYAVGFVALGWGGMAAARAGARIIAGSFVGCLSGVGWRAFVISAWPGAVCLRSGAGGAEDGARLRFFLGVQKRDPWHQVRTYPRREKQILRPAFPIVCCRTQRGPKSPQRRRPVLGDPDGRAGFQDDTASGNGAMRTRGAWLRGAMPSPIDGVRGQSEVRAFPP